MEQALQTLGMEVPDNGPRVQSIRIRHSVMKQVGWRWERTTYWPMYGSRQQEPTRDVPEYLLQAVETAMEHSARRLAPLSGRTAVFVDLSGSMHVPVSAKSVVTRMEAACTLGGLIDRQMQGEVYAFGTSYRVVEVQSASSALQAAQRIQAEEHRVGYGTYLLPALEAAFSQNFDRLIVLTDEQVADQSWRAMKNYLNQHPDCTAYVLNLAGYSPSMATQHERLVTVGGFSDRVLDWIGALELPDPVAVILGQ